MNGFTILFALALAASLGLQTWLGRRQIAYLRAHRESVPEDFRRDVSADDHRKAADYTEARTNLNLVAMAVNAFILLGWTLGGGLELLDALWRGTVDAVIPRGIGVILSALLIMTILELPLSVYAIFVLEERFGFNRMTARLFVADLVKTALLMLAVGTPLVWAILWLMAASGPYWWLYAWAVWTGFSLLRLWAYPRFIAPLFNKFSPLADQSLEARIRRLAERCGFAIRDVFVMDGSRRSSHGNAYFTGLGANRRIVLFDTLVGSMEEEEIEAVLAHEIGHFRRRHVQKLLAAAALLSLAGFMLLGWLSGEAWFYAGLGVGRPSDYAALMLFVLIAPVFGVFLRPAASYLSRRFEYEADDYAAAHSRPQALVRALVKLYRDNASTLTPDPVYSAFYHSHPPPPLRVAHLKNQGG